MNLLAPGTFVLDRRFQVIRHLGGGGMSQVYLAEQMSLGRKVALKVLRQDIARRPEVGERFRREAKILSTVDHPAVVRVIDFEQSAELTCLVLELAEGPTLDEVLQKGPLEPARAVMLLQQLAEGLAAIHGHGVVHRDLKPQNVVLSPTPRGEQARLLDFGIAKLLEDHATHLSMPGQVVGTPAYLAPEQATGKPLDERTDVYTFGLLAYRMLAGALPFSGPTPKDFLIQHVTATPEPIERKRPSLAPHRELCRLVMSCLEKDLTRRPANGSALVEALQRVSTRPPSTRPPQADVASDPATELVAIDELEREPSTLSRRLAAGQAVSAQRPPAQRPKRPWHLALASVALLALAGAASLWAYLQSPLFRVERLLEQGEAEQALQLLAPELEAPGGDLSALYALQAVALHQLNRHREEGALLTQYRHQILFTPHPLLLDALAEDYGRKEANDELRGQLAAVPRRVLVNHFLELAQGPPSPAQWGALRYLDALDEEGLDKVTEYIRSLASSDCEIRASAARRLGQLGDNTATEALRQLSMSPREAGRKGNCGHDEAAAALRKIAKRTATP